MTKKKPTLEEFMAEPSARGPRCTTCAHRRREEIDRDTREFQEKRTAQQTTQTWTSFVKVYLKSRYGYTHVVSTLKQHAEQCLGLELS